MKVLLIVSDLFLGEPLGILLISAILKRAGHQTKLVALRRHDLLKELVTYEPDVVAYSAMTPESQLFAHGDALVRQWAEGSKGRILRIMGGAHPTYFPEVVRELSLDAICVGDGDNAILSMMSRFENGESLSGIPNVVTPQDNVEQIPRELVSSLDDLPFADKSVYYEAAPIYRNLAMRSLMAGRGCPYACTYCHNHAFRKFFGECGNILRRRSVENVISEIKHICTQYPPVRLIKFNDDTFAYRIDDWMLEFADRYKKEIGLPFYCLMRSNTLTEDMARLLNQAGCVSIGMSVETGDEVTRNKILKRGLTDKAIIDSFRFAKKYNIKTYGNTLLAIPGTTLEDDFNSFLFTKKLGMTVPTFAIFNPYHKTVLTEYAIQIGVLSIDYDGSNQVGALSPMNNYTPSEKKKQLALAYLGCLFCSLPDSFIPLLRLLLKVPALWIYKFLGSAYMITKTGVTIFPGIYPVSPSLLYATFKASMKFFVPGKNLTALAKSGK